MDYLYQRTLFIFRRDLRVEDNTGLNFALEHSKSVIPCFIFTPEQIEHNPYRSDHCLQFMIESLEDLERQLELKKGHLFLFYGKPEDVVKQCIERLGVDAVVVNKDYTPYSLARDQQIASICDSYQTLFHSFDDALLHPPEDTLKSNGKPYAVFTPFFRNALKMEVKQPVTNKKQGFFNEDIAFEKTKNIYDEILPKRSTSQVVTGGRESALKCLSHLSKFSHYAQLRDIPSANGTTHLSPYLKFTVCSPREIYYAICNQLGKDHDLIRQLYWRDFFTSIAYFFPHVFQGAFHSKYDKIAWSYDEERFKLWCEGRTGFPIIDAGMREMNATGFMHNRVRMVVASFLTKDLHIDWRWGEKYFAQKLIDYDPAVNNGNWQWAASTGCDAQPYFRIFNPWNQQKKFDPDCIYIKQWIPELRSFEPKVLHEWFKEAHHCSVYPKPIVDHSIESKATLKMYTQ